MKLNEYHKFLVEERKRKIRGIGAAEYLPTETRYGSLENQKPVTQFPSLYIRPISAIGLAIVEVIFQILRIAIPTLLGLLIAYSISGSIFFSSVVLVTLFFVFFMWSQRRIF